MDELGMAMVVWAACGVIGGAVGHLVARRVASPASRRTVWTVSTIAAIAIGNQLVAPVVLEWWADARARTPAERYERAFAKLVSSDPAITSYTRDLERRASPEKRREEWKALAARGVARLGERDLLLKAELLSKGLAAVDDATCASVGFAGGASAEDHRKVVNALSVAEASEFARIAVAAVRAEVVQDAPARPPTTEQDVERVIELVAARASPDQLDAISNAFEPGAPPATVCAAVRALYAHLSALPRAEQPRLVLLLTGL
jgi:hypothetical protein